MTAVHHTPLSFGGPLTSAAMESPLSQLDAAIATVIATGSGFSTTLTAQANAGTSGPFSVASTAGLLPGDPIYLGTGATFESRIVNTVPSGTTFTVTVNLTNTYAIGKPVSKSPVEIVDARGGQISLGARLGLMESAFNVKRYGAIGNGVADDTAAINAAIGALNAAGRGILYFPHGRYRTSGGHLISSNTLILGDGAGNAGNQDQHFSLVECTSATAVLFDFTASAGRIERIAFDNVSAGATAGSAVRVDNATAYFLQQVDVEAARISRFYIGVDIRVGSYWTIRGCSFLNNVLYGVKVQNTQMPDSGDWAISDCHFLSAGAAGATGIRIESSGGGKITNCKILNGVNGIDLAVGASIATVILLVNNCSIEEYTNSGIKGTTSGTAPSTWGRIIVSGNEIVSGVSTGPAISLVATVLADFDAVVIVGNSLDNGGAAVPAIQLTNVNNAYVGPHDKGAFASVLAMTTCTNVNAAHVIARGGGIARITAPVAIANVAASVVELTLPAGLLSVGSSFRFTAYGRLTSGATPGSSIFLIRAGADVPTLANLTIANAANRTNAPFKVEGLMTIRSVGATGTAIAELSAIGGTSVVPFTPTGDVTSVSAPVTLDTRTGGVFLTYQSGNAGTTATFEAATIEAL